MYGWAWIEEQTSKRCVLKRVWTKCWKFVNHSRRHSQHNWGDLYDHSITQRIFTLSMNRVFIQPPIFWGRWLQAQFGFANHLTIILCFLSYEKCLFKTHLPYLSKKVLPMFTYLLLSLCHLAAATLKRVKAWTSMWNTPLTIWSACSMSYLKASLDSHGNRDNQEQLCGSACILTGTKLWQCIHSDTLVNAIHIPNLINGDISYSGT